jgi:glucose-6-phosphate isomerase
MGSECRAFTETSVYEKLTVLAENPYDLTGTDALTKADRLSRYVVRSPMLNFHYATQRVDDSVLGLLQQLADELDLVGQFTSMRRGAVLNRIEGYESEDRQVLHTSSRDLFSSPPAEPVATAAARKELDKLQTFLERIAAGTLTNREGKPFDTMVHVGIGGSDLGPRAIYESLAAR